jgi:hypothetical protein
MNTRDQLIQQLEDAINGADLHFKDKVNAMAQVLIDMGVALEPDVHGPLTVRDLKHIEQKQYEEPSVGKALILQGSMMLSWDA